MPPVFHRDLVRERRRRCRTCRTVWTCKFENCAELSHRSEPVYLNICVLNFPTDLNLWIWTCVCRTSTPIWTSEFEHVCAELIHRSEPVTSKMCLHMWTWRNVLYTYESQIVVDLREKKKTRTYIIAINNNSNKDILLHVTEKCAYEPKHFWKPVNQKYNAHRWTQKKNGMHRWTNTFCLRWYFKRFVSSVRREKDARLQRLVQVEWICIIRFPTSLCVCADLRASLTM